jgi:hypothetical protein
VNSDRGVLPREHLARVVEGHADGVGVVHARRFRLSYTSSPGDLDGTAPSVGKAGERRDVGPDSATAASRLRSNLGPGEDEAWAVCPPGGSVEAVGCGKRAGDTVTAHPSWKR